LRGKRFLIHDRDPLYTRGFHEILGRAGVAPVRLPPKSPNLNAYAERFVLSIKSECLDRLVMLGEGTCGERLRATWSTITWSGATRVSVTG
jgi:transposase InsO family protein